MVDVKVIYICFSAVFHAALNSIPDDERRALVDELKQSEEADADTPGAAAAGSAFVGCILDAFFNALDPEVTRDKKFVFVVEESSETCVRAASFVVARVAERPCMHAALVFMCVERARRPGPLCLIGVLAPLSIFLHIDLILFFCLFPLKCRHMAEHVQVHVEARQPPGPGRADVAG